MVTVNILLRLAKVKAEWFYFNSKFFFEIKLSHQVRWDALPNMDTHKGVRQSQRVYFTFIFSETNLTFFILRCRRFDPAGRSASDLDIDSGTFFLRKYFYTISEYFWMFQDVLVKSSRKIDPINGKWITNGAGWSDLWSCRFRQEIKFAFLFID